MKISVVIPIYGVEAFIDRCLRSVLEQDYAEKELILVDDCSVDRSLSIAEEVLSHYPNTEVHIVRHAHNRGLAAARLSGLQQATGRYILSVDGDDCLAPHALALLAAKAQETDADIIRMDCYFDWISTQSLYRGAWTEDAQAYSLYLLSGRTMPSMWLHMIKADLYTRTGIYPVEGIDIGEDYMLLPRLCRFANRVAYVPQALYYYNQTHAGSYMHAHSETSIRHLTQAVQTLTAFFANQPDCAEALRAGQWLKKTDLMMHLDKRQYALANAMPTSLPLTTTTMNLPQRIAAHMIANRQWNLLWTYCQVYNTLMEGIQRLKGRRRTC